MSEEQPRHTVTERISALETALAGLEKMLAYRERMLQDGQDRLDAHNRGQDVKADEFAKEIRAEIKEIKGTVWSAVRWLGSATGLVLLSATFKTLGLL